GLMKRLYKPKFQIATPQFSPDGSKIAFIEGLMSDEGLTGGDILSVDAAGGDPENLTPNRKSSPSWFTWTRQGKILLGESAEADSEAGVLDPAARRADALWRGPERVTAGGAGGLGGWGPTLSASSDGKTTAIIRSSAGIPPEVWAGAIGEWKQLTHRNAN